MVGSKQFTIQAEDFVKGMSSSPDLQDGGFSNETTQVNLLANPGQIFAPGALTDKSTNLEGEIIASAGDANSGSNPKYFLDDEGKFYTWSGSTLTKRQTDASGTYTFGTTDFVQFKLETFATTTTNVVKLGGSDLTSIDATWWTGTRGEGALDSTQKHPLLVFEDALWIGDKNELHKWDGTTSTEARLELSSEQSIVSLGIDPASGKMLIGVTEGTNSSNLKPQIAKVLIWDGFSNKVNRAVIVDDAINAFYPVGGTVYVTYGKKLGYWNGNGITFLRTFKNVTLSVSDIAFKHHITNIGETLYIVDGTQILAYGEILGGQQKVFRYALKNAEGNEGNYLHVSNIGEGKLGLGFATSKFYTFDTLSVSAVRSGGASFFTNKYNFPRPVGMRGVRIYFNSSLPVTAENLGTVAFIGDNNTATTIKTIGNTVASTYYVDCDFPTDPNMTVQFRVNISPETASNVFGIKRMIVFYDVVE